MSRCRWIFAIAAAVSAAATIDPFVEHLSNSGLFGAHTFTDHSTADVVPALCVAVLCSTIFILLAAARLLGSARFVSRLLQAPARELGMLDVRRMLPWIFVLQIAVLFVMETTEQRLIVGHYLGGTIWLGGPPFVSLAMHFVGCVLVSYLLSRMLQALARRVIAVVQLALRLIFMLHVETRTRFVRLPSIELAHIFAPLLTHPTVRPPPLSAM